MPEFCAHIWELMDPSSLPNGAEKKHLLYALIFLMIYGTESLHASMAGGVDEATFRNWSWFFVNELSLLEAEVVSSCCEIVHFKPS